MFNNFKRAPDYTIFKDPKDPYLKRWFLLPHNKWCNVYLHQFLRSDSESVPHDHPWNNCSIILKGKYKEVLYDKKESYTVLRKPGNVIFRKAGTPHKIVLFTDENLKREIPVWTIFITGPKIREWGFHCDSGWMHWKKFINQ